MKKLYLLLPILFLIYWGCEDKEEDTTPPTVSISYPLNNSTVSEMVTINCISSDNEGVDKVELWVNGVSTDISDNTEPYSFDWNTTLIDNGSYSITVRSFDTSGNTSDSEPIVLNVDNTQSSPQPVNITSIVFENGGFTITWNQSTDGDFDSYELEKSVESMMGDYEMIYTTDEVTNTTYVDSDIDPLSYQYYRITVIDTFSYETKGQIVSSSLDPVPTSVNVTSVTYTLDEMTVEWGESSDGDFRDYKLLYSESESGDKDTLETYTDKSTTSHIITDFDPTHENWYWVIVSDTLGQFSIGIGMTNEIESPPTQSELYPIVYENGSFIITWSQNDDGDFQSYTLYESLSEDMSGQTVVFTSENNSETSYTVTGVGEDELRYYQIVVTDIFNLETSSSVVSGFSHIFSESIVFVSDGYIDIMDVNGSNQTNLTTIVSNSPRFSPDGSKIVFWSNPSSTQGIYIMDVNGSNLTHLTNSGNQYRFSPDGSKIVYELDLHIYIMNVDGSSQNQLTGGYLDLYPQFSPDGSKIVFQSYSPGNNDIYTMNVDGSNQTNLTNNSYNDDHPKFSPDGSKILFLSYRNSNHDIYIMDVDGSNEIQLTNNNQQNYSPYSSPDGFLFSPDGSKIVFVSKTNNLFFDIYTMDVDGSNQINLTNNNSNVDFPQFSPDGSKIVFVSDGDGNQEIYIMDSDGSNQINLTNNSGDDREPQFQPQP